MVYRIMNIYVIVDRQHMKKVIGIVFIILTMLTLTSCKGVEKSLFDQLYDDNFETAVEISNGSWSDSYGHNFQTFIKYSVEEFKEISLGWFINEPEILYESQFYNIIISEFTYSKEGCQPEIIECLNEQDAKELAEALNDGIDLYFCRENIVYNSTEFAVLFMDGENINTIGSFMYSNDKKILVGKTSQPSIYEFKLPETLESVGQYGLSFTKNIKKIICNDNLKKIGRNGMLWLPALEEVKLNEGLTVLGPLCFNYCLKLNKINIPSTIKEIYPYAFYDCESLEYIVIPKNVEYIGENTFNKTIVYCEAETLPDFWDYNFICEDAKVYWAGEWEYNSEGIPTPIK